MRLADDEPRPVGVVLGEGVAVLRNEHMFAPSSSGSATPLKSAGSGADAVIGHSGSSLCPLSTGSMAPQRETAVSRPRRLTAAGDKFVRTATVGAQAHG
jgi:hypothetical protein